MFDSFENGEFVRRNEDYVQRMIRLHLEDVKKGDVPEAGTLYSIYVLDKDRPFVTPVGYGKLDYDAFMRDDRILMLAGSPENRETLAKILFGAEKDGGEGLSRIDNLYNLYQIGDIGRDLYTLGKLDFPVGHAVRQAKAIAAWAAVSVQGFSFL